MIGSSFVSPGGPCFSPSPGIDCGGGGILAASDIATTNDLAPEDEALVGKLFRAAAAIARDRGIERSGYRVVMNANRDAGQTVFHIHLHVLGGRVMAWPPG